MVTNILIILAYLVILLVSFAVANLTTTLIVRYIYYRRNK